VDQTLHWLWIFKHGRNNILVNLLGLHNPALSLPLKQFFALALQCFGASVAPVFLVLKARALVVEKERTGSM